VKSCGAADRIRTGICSIDNRELSPVKLQPRNQAATITMTLVRTAAPYNGGCGRIRTSNAPKSSGFTAREGNQLPQHTQYLAETIRFERMVPYESTLR
jgi:hypothetical protein